MHSRNDAPITTTAATAAVWKDAMFLFPPLVEQDPCLILSGYVGRYASIMKKKKK
jgi:hypothetical protein